MRPIILRVFPIRAWVVARLVVATLLVSTAANGYALAIGKEFAFSSQYQPGDTFMQVRLLGSLVIANRKVDGYAPRELSAISWDSDEQILYAVSDDGFVAHLVPEFTQGQLVGLDYRAAYPLNSASGQPLSGEASDSEGLALTKHNNGVPGDSELLVSFENDPRVVVYSPAGRFHTQLKLPANLADVSNYAGDNSELEGLTLHPQAGIVLAPERPLRDAPTSAYTLYGIGGEKWSFAPLDPKHSDIVSLETTPDGDILVLERRYVSIFKPVIFAIRKLPGHLLNGDGTVPVTEVATFSSRDWHIDNFEGLAHHTGTRYFMISDDNESVMQRTLLIYFEIVAEGAHAPVNSTAD